MGEIIHLNMYYVIHSEKRLTKKAKKMAWYSSSRDGRSHTFGSLLFRLLFGYRVVAFSIIICNVFVGVGVVMLLVGII